MNWPVQLEVWAAISHSIEEMMHSAQGRILPVSRGPALLLRVQGTLLH